MGDAAVPALFAAGAAVIVSLVGFMLYAAGAALAARQERRRAVARYAARVVNSDG